MPERLMPGQVDIIEELAREISPATAWRYTPDLVNEIRTCWSEIEFILEENERLEARVTELERELEALD